MAATAQFNGRSTADEVVAGRELGPRRVIVTGANTGIGFDTARALAAAGASLVLACRSAASGEAAVARIRVAHPHADVVFEQLDLASFASILEFCARLGPAPIDDLVCNAGLATTAWDTTDEGFERTVGVCHIGHFLLARLLLGRLLVAPAPRVVMVSSESHRAPRQLDFERLPMTRENFRGLVAYGQAKLCNLLFAQALQDRYGGRGLTACSLHPGTLVTTDIGRDNALIGVLMRLVSPFTKTCNQGAATSVHAVVHEPASDLAAAYLRDCAVGRSTPEARDSATAARLFEFSNTLVEAASREHLEMELPPWP